MRDCYLVRGRLRQKFRCKADDSEVLGLLRRAMRSGVSPSAMHQAVDENNTLEECFVSMGIERLEFRKAMDRPIVDFPLNGQVFIRESDLEWPIWSAFWRRTRGVGAPMNKHFGWFFPSRLPPTEPHSKRASRKPKGAAGAPAV
jgi:hypothetical protein